MKLLKVSAPVFLLLSLLLISMPVWADAVQVDSLATLEELRAQNELLQQRSRFTTGGLAMILTITAMLVFLVINNRWNHRLEIKNRQLERERNVVVAQNKQLAIERDRAEQALSVKTSFIQSMTHEIRTPLNAISGFSQVLATPGIDIPQEERLDLSTRIQENTRQLTTILDDLIMISDLESNCMVPPLEDCPAAAIVGFAADAFRPLFPATLTFNIENNVSEDLIVKTNPHMISTILQKLLSNAVKFTSQGSVTLRLNSTDDQLCISVVDTGPGIPADKKDFVFERFSKLDNFVPGTGLGLSIARMIAERIHGTLDLDTSYVGGAKLDLVIPIHFDV
jgi:signal transduction histidine kinase